MKDGENCTIYINPNRPDWPKTTNYAIGNLFFVVGCVCVVVVRKENKTQRKEMV